MARSASRSIAIAWVALLSLACGPQEPQAEPREGASTSAPTAAQLEAAYEPHPVIGHV